MGLNIKIISFQLLSPFLKFLKHINAFRIIQIYPCTSIYMDTCTCVCTCTYRHVHIHMLVCVYTGVHIHACGCMCTHISTSTYAFFSGISLGSEKSCKDRAVFSVYVSMNFSPADLFS